MTTAATNVRIAIALAVMCAAAPVHAQSPQAETLFREGKKLAKKGDYAEACKRFEASEKLEQAAGTELNFGDCLEKTHKTASAWAMFIKAKGTAKRTNNVKILNEARRRAELVEKQRIFLTVDVPDDHREPGLKLQLNNVELDPTLWGQPTPVDPDEYTITAEADGYETFTATLVVRTKDKHIEIPALDKAPVPEKHDTPPDTVDHAADRQRPPPPPPPPVPQTHLRKAPLALMIGGVVLVGGGVAAGLLSQHDQSNSTTDCPNLGCPSSEGLSLNSRARTEALAADIGFGVGGAAIAAAVVWWIVGGTSTTERITLVPNVEHAGLAVVGRF